MATVDHDPGHIEVGLGYVGSREEINIEEDSNSNAEGAE